LYYVSNTINTYAHYSFSIVELININNSTKALYVCFVDNCYINLKAKLFIRPVVAVYLELDDIKLLSGDLAYDLCL